MYYNPETKETISKEALQNLLNASFPEGTILIDGWHLIDEKTLYPHLLEGQYAEHTGIAFEDGKWCRTYAVRTTAKPVDVPEQAMEQASESEDVIQAQAEKIALLEQAVADLGQMVSNLEDYRIFFEKRLETQPDESTEE